MEFDIIQIEKVFPNHVVLDQIGAGSAGKVYLLNESASNQKFALKKINCFGMCDYQKNNSMNQVRLLGSLNHPRIVRMQSCLIDSEEENIYILMEYADGGDLSQFIDQAKEKKKIISEAIIWKILIEVAEGLAYIHQNNIIHRDVKPANIFKFDNSYKLGDMNVSKVMKNAIAMTQIGTPYYSSPEMWQSEGYNEKCDVWSLGVVLYQLCSLRLPFQANSIQELTKKLKSAKVGKIPTCYSYSLQQLIMKMLDKNPKSRISSEQILQACILHGKMKSERSLQRSKGKETLMDTILFPEVSQKWINLLPMPPKSTRKNSFNKIQTIRNQSEITKSTQNNIFAENIMQNKSCVFVPTPKTRRTISQEHKQKENKSQENKIKIRLPSISKKKSTNSLNKQTRQSHLEQEHKPPKEVKKSFKRIASSRKDKNLFQQCLKLAKNKSKKIITQTNQN